MAIVTCERCGFRWEINNPRKYTNLCSSCRAVPVKTVHGIHGVCIPWHGDFDQDFVTPLDENGDPVLPGRRSCKNSDCVNPSHINKEG